MFVQMVEGIHNLPYLEAIEIFLLGFPILFHGILGVKYLFTAKFNSGRTDGSAPSLRLGRNRAYTWQRITSWILLFLLVFHIVKFRFIEYPHTAMVSGKQSYFVNISLDEGLPSVAKKLGAEIYDPARIAKEKAAFAERKVEDTTEYQQQKAWVATLSEKKLDENDVVAVAESFGTASLLTVRDTFKNPYYVALYTIFVLAACFHAFNGFWTFLITWGVVLSMIAQRRMTKVAWGLMALVAFWGLAAVWGTYWINLKT
jgi:succinate dehydrogenase / fumarate reductase cytochrome b subunit